MDKQGEAGSILFVNKFGPLSNAITGQTALELAVYLQERGIDISFLSIRASYRSSKRDIVTAPPCRIAELRGYYNGDHPVLRFAFSLLDGLRLFVHSLFHRKDIVVVMTEPPLLLFWFQLFRWMYRAKLIYWTMDVYPEAFEAGKYSSVKNPVYRWIRKIVYSKSPDFIIALGNEQFNYVQTRFPGPIPHDIISCGVVKRDSKPVLHEKEDGMIRFGYIGNLGAAHDAGFLAELLRQLDPEKHSIVLCLYGTKADSIRNEFLESAHIQYRTALSYDEIEKLDINIASLLPAWDHICVPSKAVTAICCGGALLLNASAGVDNWIMLREAGWLIEPSSSYASQVRKFLSGLNIDDINSKKIKAKAIAERCVKEKQEALERIHAQLALMLDPSATSVKGMSNRVLDS